MRILHLSDLHLTEPFRSFEEIWSGPGPLLHEGSFDFVIVSGDLSQAARAQEYTALDRFLRRSVLPLLKNPDHSRVVLVPGNHDVNWEADIGDWLPLGRELDRDKTFASRLKVALRAPEQSHDLRVSISAAGHVDVLKIDEKRYATRFAPVQGFLDAFYEEAKKGQSLDQFRSFQLTSTDEAEHWSAHVFREEGIAFYGFNSCHRNDPHWTGAMLSAKAVEAAAEHAKKHARECILVAVWHHGLDSGRGRPDHLSAEDLSLLYNRGFRIGFHGHTHKAAYETFDALFDNRFFVVSTGSLGAGSRERPDAVGNQFSIANVFESHVDVEIFTRGSSNTYERNREQRRFLLQNSSTTRLDQQNHAVRHHRTWEVGANGIARVEVRLERLTLRRELTLALVQPPFCNVKHDEHAQTPSGPVPIRAEPLPGGRTLFTVRLNAPEELPWLTWGYRISNSLAISRVDLEEREKPKPPHEVVRPGTDGCAHTVSFPSDELTLTFRFKEGLQAQPGSPAAVVLRRKQEYGHEQWVRHTAEERRTSLSSAPSEEPRSQQLVIPSPLVDYRYVLTYVPGSPGEPFSEDHTSLLNWLMEQCRDQMPGRATGSLQDVLTQAIHSGLEEVLGEPPGPEMVWTGYLWKPAASLLVASFGAFPNRLWATRFAWGSGVAGHALRFSQSASWARDENSLDESLIYRPPEPVSSSSDYTWILCLPLLASPTRAIGVVSIDGHRRGGNAERHLREHVESLARGGRASEESRLFQNTLFSAVNSAFWNVLSGWTQMTPKMTQLVQRIAQQLERTPPAPAPKRGPRGKSRRASR
jgi:predicted phosphodiesterase